MARGIAGMTVLVGLSVVAAAAQEIAPAPNKLVTGKLVYVAPMPGNLDRWIMDDLRIWGKYRATANPEGVDIAINGIFAERRPHIVLDGGIPQPRPREKKPTLPDKCPHLKPSESPAATIVATDWVTGERVWYAHLIDRNPKKGELENIPAGPHTDIFVRGLVPDQVAMRLVTKLREYVKSLAGAHR